MALGGQLKVLADANVLYPKTTRDWLALLYAQGGSDMFQVFWTDDILTETAYHLRRDHPGWAGKTITTITRQIRATFEVGRVEDYDPSTALPVGDPHDAHVHAAALACQAEILITNDHGFHAAREELPYDVYTADEFFILIDDSEPTLTRTVIELQTRYWLARQGQANLAAALALSDCPRFAERVRRHQAGAI